jgi:hypothetical protein
MQADCRWHRRGQGLESLSNQSPERPEHNLAEDITRMAVDLVAVCDEPTQPSPNQMTRSRLVQRVGAAR